MAHILKHFSFHAVPFTCEIDITKRCHFELSDNIITELRRTVERRMSAALIGPAGSGKTFLGGRLIPSAASADTKPLL